VGDGFGAARLSGRIAMSNASIDLRRAAADAIVTGGRLAYPDSLPITERRDELLAAIRDHQVVIVAGETGSGKSTQLPKLCLEAGRGVEGMIGHTQPRRVAARTIAERVADELGSKLGDDVGYTVRFTDQVSDSTLVKVMTDGILLAEIQRDRMLRRYDTLIIDEAHERSLNIDFILGYLKQLLLQRPDLKVIVTSATIDTARFADHFAADGEAAPVIEVTGGRSPSSCGTGPSSTTSPMPTTATRCRGSSTPSRSCRTRAWRCARVPVGRARDPRHRRRTAPAEPAQHRGAAALRAPVVAPSSTRSSSGPRRAVPGAGSCWLRTSPRRRSPCPASATSSTPDRRASRATAGG
jgi:hypothetical protein